VSLVEFLDAITLEAQKRWGESQIDVKSAGGPLVINSL